MSEVPQQATDDREPRWRRMMSWFIALCAVVFVLYQTSDTIFGCSCDAPRHEGWLISDFRDKDHDPPYEKPVGLSFSSADEADRFKGFISILFLSNGLKIVSQSGDSEVWHIETSCGCFLEIESRWGEHEDKPGVWFKERSTIDYSESEKSRSVTDPLLVRHVRIGLMLRHEIERLAEEGKAERIYSSFP